MPIKPYEFSKVYAVGADELYDYALSALRASGVTVDARDKNLGVIKASTALSMSKFGQNIEILIQPESPHETRVAVACSTRYIMDPFGAFMKQQEQLTVKFISSLDFIVQRAAVAKGR